VLDLGCGTGTIAKKVLETFPNASLHCVDIAENMIETAKVKLSDYKNVTFQTGNFADIEIEGGFDAALSSLAVHHLSENEKAPFYKKIYGLLKPGGCFYNADVVLAETDYLAKTDMSVWIEYMKRSVTEKEIEEKWIPAHKNEDKPSKLSLQLKQLAQAGFQNVNIIWKYYNFAVFGGEK
jgi:tRNA (cmo5U34)-methyltransferase